MKHISEHLPEHIRELYEERAAILHFDGGWPLEKAEALAKAEADTYWKNLEDKSCGVKP